MKKICLQCLHMHVQYSLKTSVECLHYTFYGPITQNVKATLHCQLIESHIIELTHCQLIESFYLKPWLNIQSP